MPAKAPEVTVSDSLEDFGPIPARRIRSNPEPGRATEQDVQNIHLREDRLYELVDGVLLEKTMGWFESQVAAWLIYFLQDYLIRNNVGIVSGADGMMRLAPGLVRIPDVAFVSRERLPGGRPPRDSIPDLVPDLAFEVLSEGNTHKEMQRKLNDYFGAGARLVWYIDARKRIVSVYTSPENVTVLDETAVIDGGNVLPGFRLAIQELFARAET
jgi:Uma2 family endonuclease